MSSPISPVLILGAGINGAALARELAVEGLDVWLVDRGDVACGATACSSRLIHGGLRYLEYGELALVRESLEERTRLLRLAPQFVQPLKLYIPIERRWSGLAAAAARLLRLERAGSGRRAPPRGLWLVRTGLWMYDAYARDPALPRHAVHRVGEPAAPRVDNRRYRWLCSYYDAQVRYPERFVVAMLEDARRAAAAAGATFRVFTYCEARQAQPTVEICRTATGEVVGELAPAAIVNATGAWVDETLRRLDVASPTLIGGTKGSHLLTSNPRLREALAGQAMYAEAGDGRPVFILPLGSDWTLIGTTDLPYEGDPGAAVCTDAERDYLLEAVNRVLPQSALAPADVDWHYSGVRPLPYVGPAAPAGVTRRHWLQEHAGTRVPLYSVIGGKLTTCRSLAESAADTILRRLGVARRASTRQRLLPGAEAYPADAAGVLERQQRLAAATGFSPAQAAAMWELCGTRAEEIAHALRGEARESLPGTDLPAAYARWVVDHEWAARLEDLVERRLMLLYDRRLSRSCLEKLAALPGVAGDVDAVIGRLAQHFGKRVGER